MKKKKVKYDLILFVLLMAFLFVFIIQELTGLFSVKPMNGVFVPTPKPKPTYESYLTSKYQSQIEKYAGENFGFRESVIRFYNQYLWDLYRKTSVSKDQLVLGKDDWLYEPGAVSDYYQRQFRFFAVDSAQMASMLSKEARHLLRLQQVLESHGTHLIVCLVPSKDLIYPEYLPENQDTLFEKEPKLSARFFNEQVFTQLGVNHLNLEQYFLQMKDTADFALFPKTGMHWSRYAALYGADTLIRYMEHLGNINMKNLVLGPRELDNARDPDDDLERLLNLLRPIPKPQYYYADCKSDGDATATMPKMIVIGDSFWWTIAFQIPLKEIFSRAPYWYYNSTIYYDDRYHSVNEINLAEELLSADFVVLSYCATQQYRMNDGFSKKALEALGVDVIAMDSTDFIEQEIQRTMNDLLADPSSMKAIQEKATKYNKTLEKALRDDAAWIVNYKIQQGTLTWNRAKIDSTAFVEREIQRTIGDLLADPGAMKTIHEKAELYKKPLEQALRDDATWIVNYKIQQGVLVWPGTQKNQVH